MLNMKAGCTKFNIQSTGNYYNFSNIRYAEPPLGRLRFAAPQSPKGRSHSVDTGSVARICPQAYPSAAFSNQIYTTFYSVTGKTSLEDFQNATQRFDYPRNTPQDPRTTEDCLFLDVMGHIRSSSHGLDSWRWLCRRYEVRYTSSRPDLKEPSW
jgi:carboxylesterase type B